MTRFPIQLKPFWRDVRFWRYAGQVLAVVAIASFALLLWNNLSRNLQQLGIQLGFDFLQSQAAFDIGETPIAYSPTDPYRQALLIGLLNSLRIMVVGILLATVVGVTVGIARLSDNWLVRQLAALYVETLRNTPLLLQLFFWYFAVFLNLPATRNALVLPGSIYLSQRGILLPWLQPNTVTPIWLACLGGGLVLVGGIWFRQQQRRQQPGSASRIWLVVLSAIALAGLLAWLLTAQPPLDWDLPRQTGAGLAGGLWLSSEFATLLIGLTLYTAAFIAEIVRAGIQAVPKGQWEAARALGLQSGLVMRLVVFPQALRIIVPPLTSQYLNLAKNSSLAIAVGYPDIYFVASTTFNQTGRAVEVMLLLMGTYLSISLLISLVMNLYNRAVQVKER